MECRGGGPSGFHFLLGAAVVWEPAGLTGHPGTGLGCGWCLQITAEGWRPCEGAWASRRPCQAGLGALCLDRAAGCQAPGLSPAPPQA